MTARRGPVVFNGKFLSAAPTGVHRVAEELIKQIFERCAADAELARALQPQLWIPSDAAEGAERAGLPYRVIGPGRGIPWEQVTLPWHARGHLLVSLCNVGPMAARNAITMFHDAQVYLTPASYSRGFRWWYHLHQPLAGQRHKRILTVSEYSRQQLVQHGLATAERISVVHNGVDHVNDVVADEHVILRLRLSSRRYVVGLANAQAHKNVRVLLEAFADPRLSSLVLVLFGSATARDFESLGHRVPPNVCFAGRITDGELRALYQGALCMAFPSTTEGFGLPPLEAMTQGCPAVVAPRGALPEVCASGALYAAHDEPSAWVDQFLTLGQSPQVWQQWSARGREQASRFTWHAAAGRLTQELLAA
jgi:glycosyltransferase involved in cell wall biosynthesis